MSILRKQNGSRMRSERHVMAVHHYSVGFCGGITAGSAAKFTVDIAQGSCEDGLRICVYCKPNPPNTRCFPDSKS
eukprot:g43996.t1